ncbi:hypothetical protein CA982_25540 [Gordonia lacunae]|uniref:Uncharacterized protein n=1 Tax=Gordonia lacunae TaxID=417102 RepID=A0A243Q308_9ACTN|nr:hypothetical protein CA982_25540 [Gordonia lacunae]
MLAAIRWVGRSRQRRATVWHCRRSSYDLRDVAPGWFKPALATHPDRQRTEGMWIGFVYGFDGQWTRSGSDLDGGFTQLS